jgi:hypothetical protein
MACYRDSSTFFLTVYKFDASSSYVKPGTVAEDSTEVDYFEGMLLYIVDVLTTETNWYAHQMISKYDISYSL